jgi:hypothetical protein
MRDVRLARPGLEVRSFNGLRHLAGDVDLASLSSYDGMSELTYEEAIAKESLVRVQQPGSRTHEC